MSHVGKTISDDKRTSSCLQLFDTDSFEEARYLVIQDTTEFDIAKLKLTAYFAITATPDALKTKVGLCRPKAGETIEPFARDINLNGHWACTRRDPELLEDIMIHVFI